MGVPAPAVVRVAEQKRSIVICRALRVCAAYVYALVVGMFIHARLIASCVSRPSVTRPTARGAVGDLARYLTL